MAHLWLFADQIKRAYQHISKDGTIDPGLCKRHFPSTFDRASLLSMAQSDATWQDDILLYGIDVD